MSHTAHPYSLRLGILRTWKSRWLSSHNYRELLREDVLLREFLEERLQGMAVDSIEIERSPNSMNLIIKTARPGLLIGRGGEGVEKLKKEIEKFLLKTGKNKNRPEAGPPRAGNKAFLKLTVEEVRSPETHAKVMIEAIAQDLEKRIPFRRVMKQNLGKISASREVKGVKISLSGRLDGAEMARYEWMKDGRIPLQTFRADVDFAKGRAHLPYGDIGIKVWIYKGEVFEKNVVTKTSKI